MSQSTILRECSDSWDITRGGLKNIRYSIMLVVKNKSIGKERLQILVGGESLFCPRLRNESDVPWGILFCAKCV